jgi:glutamate synthase (ferredoxin)
MTYCSPDATKRAAGAKAFEKVVAEEGQKVIGWRDVPVDNSMIGATAQASEPFMRMAFIARGDDCPDQQTFERNC